ncbi:hypothetical protein JHK87_031399 [Glycine soja]|nr:hypothetical protein JHK87_031399 [Glycine soja]
MGEAYAFRIDLTYELRNFTEMEQCDIIQLKKCHYIRLPPYDIDELPDKLDCPNLKLMSLRRNHCNLTIPNNFFLRDVRSKDHYGAFIHHLAVVRNKHCLMAYMTTGKKTKLKAGNSA